MKFIFGVLLSLGLLASLETAQTTYSSAVTTSSVVTTGGSTTPRNDDYYKSLLQTLAYGALAMQKISCANAKTQYPGFFLSFIMAIDADITILNNFLLPNATGVTCLSANKKIGQDLLTTMSHANDNIGCPGNLERTVTDGMSGGGLSGEDYYRCALQEQGKALNGVVDGGRIARSTGGTFERQLFKWNLDSDNIQTVVNTNDSSQICIDAIKAFAVDVQQMFVSIGLTSDSNCPTPSNSTTVIVSSTTSAGISAGGY